MLKNRSLLILLILLLIAVLAVLSCGRKGSLNPNIAPYIEISDYSGIARPDSVLTDSSMFNAIGGLIDPEIYDSLFFQEIYWKAWDVDGVVKSYAYRIGTWDSLSENWQYDQTYGVQVSEDGWVLHLQPNGEYGIWTPLKERFPKTQVYFTAIDTVDYKKNFGKFEVKCKDNYGEESEIAARYFCSWSDVPSTNVSTSQGRLDSTRVGKALNFEFKVINDNDPFGYGDEAAYFLYRFVYYRTLGTDTLNIGELGPAIDSTVWYSTQNYPEYDKALIKSHYTDGNPYNKPKLKINEIYVDGTYEVTEIQAKSVDKAGIIDPKASNMIFFVRGHFKPETMPFMGQWTDLPASLGGHLEANGTLNILPKIFVLGKYSYLTYLAETSLEIPSQIIVGETHYADRFYMDRNNNISALWSDDIQIYMRWCYLGEYEFLKPDGSAVGKKSKENHTYSYDPNLNDYNQYYCDVEYMQIQIDGGTEGLPPLGNVFADDVTGESWMHIPISQEQSCKLFGLSPGHHIFKVRAMDNQGAIDPTPESIEFYLYEVVPSEEKNGILLVDDTDNDQQGLFASDSLITEYYDILLDNSWEDVTKISLTKVISEDSIAVKNSQMRQIKGADANAPYFAPSDIQQYKLIVWHCNNPKVKYYESGGFAHLVNHYNVLSPYISTEGCLLFSGTQQIWDPIQVGNKFLQSYGGLDEGSSELCDKLEEEDWYWGNPNSENSMFRAVNGMNSFSTVNLIELNLHRFCWHDYISAFPDTLFFPEYWFYTPLGAIGNVTYLNVNNAEPIFSCVTDTTQIHQEFEGACVGTKYQKDETTGNVYILGFPLYYMMPDESKNLINIVFEEAKVIPN